MKNRQKIKSEIIVIPLEHLRLKGFSVLFIALPVFRSNLDSPFWGVNRILKNVPLQFFYQIYFYPMLYNQFDIMQ